MLASQIRKNRAEGRIKRKILVTIIFITMPLWIVPVVVGMLWNLVVELVDSMYDD